MGGPYTPDIAAADSSEGANEDAGICEGPPEGEPSAMVLFGVQAAMPSSTIEPSDRGSQTRRAWVRSIMPVLRATRVAVSQRGDDRKLPYFYGEFEAFRSSYWERTWACVME